MVFKEPIIGTRTQQTNFKNFKIDLENDADELLIDAIK
jgi:hypothetical protein